MKKISRFLLTKVCTYVMDLLRYIYRGWSPKFATGLNVIIGIDQKISERPDCSFAKMMYS